MAKKYRVSFLENLCKGCGLCEAFCPVKIITLDTEKINSSGYVVATIKNIERCIGCASCAIICPDSVIKIESEE